MTLRSTLRCASLLAPLALAATVLCGAAQAADTKSYDSSKPSFWQHPPPDWFLGDERVCHDQPGRQEKSRRMIAERVEAHGGLPMHLDGMAMTCREQQADGDYRKRRERLDQYARGDLPAEAVIAAPCDAPEITP